MLKSEFLNAAEFRKSLESKGVETRPMVLGLDRQPIYSNLDFFGKSRFPKADSAYKYGLFLPSGVGTTEADIDFVCKKISEF
jgi:dTDP-4-amino-4,6-dideoxygalactose transaminase